MSQMLPADKPSLRQAIIERLGADLDIAERAARTAYETATHEENVAENKYDTLGLEASYLATGQARRMEQIRHAVNLYQRLELPEYHTGIGIALGALVALEAEDGQCQLLFLGPEAAGLKIEFEGQAVTVITPKSPLGQGLYGKRDGDEITVTVGRLHQTYTIAGVA